MKKEERKPTEGTKKQDKKPYRKPEIESTTVFETFTMQSCNLTPDDGCIGQFE